MALVIAYSLWRSSVVPVSQRLCLLFLLLFLFGLACLVEHIALAIHIDHFKR